VPGVGSSAGAVSTVRAIEPTPEQTERAVAALVPYVQEWNLPLNPEHLYELAGAVLTHFDGGDSFESIDKAERLRIEEFAREQAQLYRG
jgi:hypothetical protein